MKKKRMCAFEKKKRKKGYLISIYSLDKGMTVKKLNPDKFSIGFQAHPPSMCSFTQKYIFTSFYWDGVLFFVFIALYFGWTKQIFNVPKGYNVLPICLCLFVCSAGRVSQWKDLFESLGKQSLTLHSQLMNLWSHHSSRRPPQLITNTQHKNGCNFSFSGIGLKQDVVVAQSPLQHIPEWYDI